MHVYGGVSLRSYLAHNSGEAHPHAAGIAANLPDWLGAPAVILLAALIFLSLRGLNIHFPANAMVMLGLLLVTAIATWTVAPWAGATAIALGLAISLLVTLAVLLAA